MDLLLLIIAFSVGAGLSYILVSFRYKDYNPRENDQVRKDLAALNIEKATLSSKLHSSEELIQQFRNDLARERESVIDLTRQVSTSQESFKNAQVKLNEQKSEIDNLHKTLLEQFESISTKVLRNNSANFSLESNEKLNTILNPLKDKIEKFEQKVQDTYEKSLKDSISLHEQIKSLSELNKQISSDAINLTQALKGEKKIQGNWGEMLLESLLEKAGLERGTQYVSQVTLENDEGAKMRPDIIINLPDNKHLVIDSKVSLVDYNDYCCEDYDDVKLLKLRSHISCIRMHCTALGNKRYDTLYGINSPDYVLMFIPIEPSFTLAMQNDSSLFLWALEKNVVMVTSSTLLATLRTVASIWKQENQKRNVLEIAEESGKLYDKFVGFLDDFTTIGEQIGRARSNYDSAMNKLTEGSGNLITRFEKLKKLGAKATKSIDPKLSRNLDG